MSVPSARPHDATSTGFSASKALLCSAAVSALALALRFTHLSAGLRHEPHTDEQVFVEETQWMIRRGDWTPRFFEYPGLLFWILRAAFVLWDAHGADAYLVARSVIAVFSSAAVFGVTLLGCRWLGVPVGVFSGLLLAVSPVSVHTAHSVRPDEMIGALVLAALAAAVPLSGRPHHALGWCLGAAAVATKFSAALVFPALLLGAFLDRLPVGQIVRLGALALVTFCALSPWTLLAGSESLKGMTDQVGYHYATETGPLLPSLSRHLTHTLPLALSWAGLGLVGVGMLTHGRTSRGLTWILFIGLWILVFSSTGVPFIRFMVPILGAMSLLAGAGLAHLVDRGKPIWKAAGYGLGLFALVVSSTGVARYLEEFGRPSTKDRALDWIESARGLERVASSEKGLGRPSGAKTEIVDLAEGGEKDGLLIRQFDALILSTAPPVDSGFLEVARFTPGSDAEGNEVVILIPKSPLKVAAVPLSGAKLTTTAPDRDLKLLDNELNTRWRSDKAPAFIEITLPAPVTLARVELAYGRVSPPRDQISKLWVDGRVVRFVRVRGPVQRQRGDRDASELLAFDTSPARTVRIEFHGPPPFIAGELRLYSR